MTSAQRSAQVTIIAAAAESVEADVLVVPVFDQDDLADEPEVQALVGPEVERRRAAKLFTGESLQCVWVRAAEGWQSQAVLVVGVGSRASWTPERCRQFAAAGALAARANGYSHIALLERGEPAPLDSRGVEAMVEGALHANFNPSVYKTEGPEPAWIESIQLRLHAVEPWTEQALTQGVVFGESVNLARELANSPGNVLTPEAFAARAVHEASQVGLRAEVLDEHQALALGMRLLLGVAQGSRQPPRVIVLHHDPPGAPPSPVLGLVGKGITFDTGGISIKPADKMDRMKDDMSGGAAVVAAMLAIARLGAPIRCVGVVPTSENMPDGNAVKPGDVLESADGMTVEIINTDAEGRLVLADGVWYARRLGATHLVDVATLTGACVVALGHSTTGLFGQPDAWVDTVRQASERAGERMWPMPTTEDYRLLLKSEIADMANAGSRAASAISAAWFVGAFARNQPWAHLDIAGTAWFEEATPFQPTGATGVAVRTLAELALAPEAWRLPAPTDGSS